MTSDPRTWHATLWRRGALIGFIAFLIVASYAAVPAGAWTLDKFTVAIVRLAFVVFFSSIIDSNARAFENNARAFASLEASISRMHMLRLATESLATTLDLIRLDLANNMEVTVEGAKASATAAELAALVAAQAKAQREAASVEAASARDEIKVAVAGVQEAAQAAYHEANDVNVKIAHLHERILNEEKKISTDAPADAERAAIGASLKRIEHHAAAIEHNTSKD